MIKKRFAVFMIAVFIMSLPAIVNADFGDEIKLLASNGMYSDSFGNSVSISGDTAIVGARGADSAYVFVRDPDTGDWTEQKILAGAANTNFGYSVSISGDTAIVGAADAASAYVFVRTPGTGDWTEQKILAGAANTYFGSSVSISGDTAIVGAMFDVENGRASGAAYIFVRNPDTGDWTEQKILADDGLAGDWFGQSVSISGDTAIVGAKGDDGTFYNSGSAYIFVRTPGTDDWEELGKIFASDDAAEDQFGTSVSISGDTAIVGKKSGLGAYVFVRDSGTGYWKVQRKLLASGSFVSISGDTAVVGAYKNDENGNDSGAADVFVRDPGTVVWTEQQKLTASVPTAYDYFGTSVSISGNTVIIGAYGNDEKASGAGAAYIYTETAVTDTAPEITVTDSVAPASDLSVPFGDVTVSTSSLQTVTITNNGNADLILGDIGLADPVPDPFNWMDDCFAQTLAPGASCTFDLYFLPDATGTFNDSFDIPSNDPDEATVIVSLSGTGVTAFVAPEIDVSPPALNFNNVVVGGSSSPLEVTIGNTGTDDLSVSDIALTDSTNFSLNVNGGSTPCGTMPTVEVDDSCTVEITFTPGAVGAFNATLAITSDDSDEATVNVSLSGNGVAAPAPEIDVSPLALNFNDVVVGGSSSPLEVTISNTGTAELSVSDILLSDSTNFGLNVNGGSTPCGSTMPTVEDDDSCTVEITFTPDAVGAFNATLTIASDDSDESTVEIVLTGNGTSAPAPNISVSPLTLDSGEVVIKDSSSPSEVTISNMGTVVLNVTNIALESNDYSLEVDGGSNPCGETPLEIVAGENCTIEITFTPKSVGTLNDTLTIRSNDDDEPDVDVLLTGVGLDDTVVHVTAATGTGSITIDTSGNAGTFCSGVHAYLDTDPSLNQTDKPADVEFPDGLVAFKVNGVDPGGTIDVTITFPTVFSEGATYYKVDADGFYEFQGAVINGSTVILTLTDGGHGDNDGIANGVIDGPGGVAILVADIETEAETTTGTVPRSKDHSHFLGCSIKPNAGQGFDPVLPMLALISVVYLFNRRRRTRN